MCVCVSVYVDRYVYTYNILHPMGYISYIYI